VRAAGFAAALRADSALDGSVRGDCLAAAQSDDYSAAASSAGTICLRTSGRLWQLLRRRRPICRRRIHRPLIIHTLVGSWLRGRTIWLIRGQLRNGLPWVNCIRLIRRRWSGFAAGDWHSAGRPSNLPDGT